MSVNESQVIKSDIRPPVQVKSLRDGLLFLLDDGVEIEALIAHLHELLHGETQSVFDGPEVKVSVDFGGRTLSAWEGRGIIEVFLSKENFVLVEWGAQTSAKKLMFQSRSRTPGQFIYKGTVRAGQRLVFDGDVVVIGDVNPGGEVVAGGDVFVFGKLAGIAHAGAAGDVKSVIAGAEFAPMQLRIASVISRSPEDKGRAMHTTMEFAYLREDGMAVDKMQYLASMRNQQQFERPLNEGELA